MASSKKMPPRPETKLRERPPTRTDACPGLGQLLLAAVNPVYRAVEAGKVLARAGIIQRAK